MRGGVAGRPGPARRRGRAHRGMGRAPGPGARLAGPGGVECVGGRGACATGGRDASARSPRVPVDRPGSPDRTGGRRRVNRGRDFPNASPSARASQRPHRTSFQAPRGRALTHRPREGRCGLPRLLHHPAHPCRSVRVEPTAPRQAHHRDPIRPGYPVRLPGAAAPVPARRPSDHHHARLPRAFVPQHLVGVGRGAASP